MDEAMFSLSFPNVTGENKTKEGKKKNHPVFSLQPFLWWVLFQRAFNNILSLYRFARLVIQFSFYIVTVLTHLFN
jgi:hypothetical protein